MIAADTVTAKETSMQFKTSEAVHPDVIARFCGEEEGPAPLHAVVPKNSAGNIGGYVWQREMRDSPIYYLDCDGKSLAMFHIFGPEEEKKKNTPIIDALREAFPVEETLVCPGSDKKPAP